MRFATIQHRSRIAAYAATALFLFSSCQGKSEGIQRAEPVMVNGSGHGGGQTFAPAQKTDAKAQPVARKTKLDELLTELRQKIDAIGSWHNFTKGFEDIAKLTGMAAMECNNAVCAKSIADLMQSLDKKLETYGHPWAAVAHSILSKMQDAVKEGHKPKLIGLAVFFRFSGTAQIDWMDILFKSIDMTQFIDLAGNKTKKPSTNVRTDRKDSPEFKDLVSSLTHPSLDPKLSKALMELLDQGEVIPHIDEYEQTQLVNFLNSLRG